ncbi:MAG: hypothetical protein NZ530_03240 [Thermodesulfobacteriaceae bacterium]|nr:hypothetical protein [Thermodesulfobacteriaceae bacterium]
MALIQIKGKLEIKGIKKVIFILDTSESAYSYWNEIASLTSQLIALLPKDMEGELYFLGNSNPIEISQFDKLTSQFFEENLNRISLITPIFEKLSQKEDIFNILIIGSGKIFDLEDWADSHLLKQTLLISVKDSLQGELSLADEISYPTAQQIYTYLYDPIIEVEISGKGFMPLKWSNGGYSLNIIEGKAYLTASKLDNYFINLEYLITSDFSPQAKLTYASGQKIIKPIQNLEIVEMKEEDLNLISLTSEEEEIFKKAIFKKPFLCIHCKKTHEWNTLYCLNTSSILGEPIYPSLNNYKISGFVLFYQKDEKVYFQDYPFNLLKIDENTVAFREGRRAVLYKYSEKEDMWIATSHTLDPYSKIKEGVYAVVF